MRSTDLVMQLERSLLTPAVRGDRAGLDTLLHLDFVEVGASGRRWDRSEVIDALLAAPAVDGLQVEGIVARALADDVVLVTYTTRRAAVTVHRSSIWVRHEGRWVVLFHQGTPAG